LKPKKIELTEDEIGLICYSLDMTKDGMENLDLGNKYHNEPIQYFVKDMKKLRDKLNSSSIYF